MKLTSSSLLVKALCPSCCEMVAENGWRVFLVAGKLRKVGMAVLLFQPSVRVRLPMDSYLQEPCLWSSVQRKLGKGWEFGC